MTYVRYKFQKAINELSRDGSLGQRLINAYLVNLMHIDLNELPDAVRNDFAKFKNRIIKNRQGESYLTVESIIKHMAEADIQRLVDELYKMYAMISKQDKSLDHVA